ncbi:MAG: AAA family ATPase [Blastocatellia bacterium]
MKKESLIKEALNQHPYFAGYYVGEQLAEMYPDRYAMQTDYDLDLSRFRESEECEAFYEADVYNQVATLWDWSEEDLIRRDDNVWMTVFWQQHMVEVVRVTQTFECDRHEINWVVADTRDIAEEFLRAVVAWNRVVRGEVLVYEDGRFAKSTKLYESIKSTTFDNLILPAPLKEELRGDLTRFFAAREMYERYGIPWKRGLILTGPPGNGKTHAVKAILNHLGKPCIYVKSFNGRYGQDGCIKQVFEVARTKAPCVVVLEDLDALVNGNSRSVFLNEMDGFSQNSGIVVLASSNYPEKLDPAIINRPSRFDRVFQFELPAIAERIAFLTHWNEAAEASLRMDTAAIRTVAEKTDDFSFAYLKELVLSSMMKWVNEPAGASFGDIMLAQVGILREQMKSARKAARNEDDDDEATRFQKSVKWMQAFWKKTSKSFAERLRVFQNAASTSEATD